jgi:hypothetical protein
VIRSFESLAGEAEQEVLPGVFSKVMSMLMPWISMSDVVTAVPRHGNKVVFVVAVHVGAPVTSGKIKMQCPPNTACEMFRFVAVTTFAVNDERVQLEVTRPNVGLVLENPMLDECSTV